MSLSQFLLFGDDGTPEVIATPTVTKRPRSSSGWQLADHACRHCFGRVLQRVVKGEVVQVRCAECGKQEDGPPRMLCCCGADCGDLGLVLECVRNKHVTNEMPHEILVKERRIKSNEQAKPAARPVNVKDY